jgi:hypothetical protein
MYEIKITANSLYELEGRVFALANQLASQRRSEPPSAPEGPSPVVRDEEAQPVQPAVNYDYETVVKPLVLRVVSQKGRDAAQALLATFGVNKAPLIPVEQRPAFVAAATSLLAG